MLKKLLQFCKKEIILTIAMLLAIISACFVFPDKQYLTYVDFRSLAILFCLMAVMAGLQTIGFFDFIAEQMLKKVKKLKGLLFLLIMLCFFSSMFITNDVALITFVPFTFIVLKMLLGEKTERLLIPVVVLQTVAANLGSMMTPIGNPQNLYLYGMSDLSLIEFMKIVLPYVGISFLLLACVCLFYPYKSDEKIAIIFRNTTSLKEHKTKVILYGILFLLSVLAVAHIIPYEYVLIVVAVAVFFADKKVLLKVDYNLLFTFVAFFIFIGNMGRIPAFYELLQRWIVGNEVVLSIGASQVMSNVPAALLLSGFTDEVRALIIGTNLGGLGTLIASMASLISFKFIAKDYGHLRGKYMLVFTAVNVLFLAVLFGAFLVL